MPEPAFDLQLFTRLRPQTPIVYFRSTPSTMTEGARLVREGAASGTVVIAEEQTAGQGRLGRHWVSSAGLGLYCSILLRWKLPPAQLPLVSLALGLATATAIERETGIKPDLRWPNDVMLGREKVAGILPQVAENWIIAGIGINVNQVEFPEGLRTPATSLRRAANRSLAREPLLARLVTAVDDWGLRLVTEGPPAILEAFGKASSMVNGCRVVLEDRGGRAMTEGLDENGFLMVRLPEGRLERIAAGGVRPE